MLKLTVVVLTVALASTAHAGGWRALRIDGSSEASFSDSVAALQDKLAPVRQYVFGRALQDIWLSGTERAEAEQREYTAEDYFRQLDGLGYKDVVTFTDPTGRTALTRFREEYARLYATPAFGAPSPPPQQPGPIGFSGEQVRGFDNQVQAIQERLSNQGGSNNGQR
jgi:hypothetical protein